MVSLDVKFIRGEITLSTYKLYASYNMHPVVLIRFMFIISSVPGNYIWSIYPFSPGLLILTRVTSLASWNNKEYWIIIQSANLLCFHILFWLLTVSMGLSTWPSSDSLPMSSRTRLVSLCKQRLHRASISPAKHRWFQRPVSNPTAAAANGIFQANGSMP